MKIGCCLLALAMSDDVAAYAQQPVDDLVTVRSGGVYASFKKLEASGALDHGVTVQIVAKSDAVELCFSTEQRRQCRDIEIPAQALGNVRYLVSKGEPLPTVYLLFGDTEEPLRYSWIAGCVLTWREEVEFLRTGQCTTG